MRPISSDSRVFLLLALLAIHQVQAFVPSSSLPNLTPDLIHDRAKLTRTVYMNPTPNDDDDDASTKDELSRPKHKNNNNNNNTASKRDMLNFAIPALGIYLTSPLLSNIDNAFVGRTVGTTGLAALSPATIGTDQMLYLFSFLGRATTSLVARAYGRNDNGNVPAARQAGSAPLVVSLLCGAGLSVGYAVGTPTLLALLQVDVALRPAAASYLYWRGAVAWAALGQTACLSMLMATRDVTTPLKIVGLAAVVNILGDALLCVWPLQWGCAGAAAATSVATLLSGGAMVRGLARKGLLPKIRRVPTRKEMRSLFEFTGPLLAITITRLGGFIAMQRTAMQMGVRSLAGYQLCINLLLFFLLFGEPLSQLSQTKLPALLDDGDGTAVMNNLRSVLTLGVFVSLGVAAVSYAAALFGSGLISSDAAVQAVAKATAPALFLAVATTIFAVAVDGAMLASRDFGFMFLCGLGSFVMQLALLPHCRTVSDIFGTFTLRLGFYAVAGLGRMALGAGVIGQMVREKRRSHA